MAQRQSRWTQGPPSKAFRPLRELAPGARRFGERRRHGFARVLVRRAVAVSAYGARDAESCPCIRVGWLQNVVGLPSGQVHDTRLLR